MPTNPQNATRVAGHPTTRFYAHTAEDAEGNRIEDQSQWQPLADHLRNVAELAAKFAAPMGPEAAAEARSGARIETGS